MQKTLDKAQRTFMIFKKIEIRELYFGILKAIYNRHIANRICTEGEMNADPLKAGIRQGITFLHSYST